MASNLDIPQFGTGATPGLNAPRMQAIWTFLKAIGSGGAGSVVKADDATTLAATTPSAVGLSMLSAADKAAQQALVSLPEVSHTGLQANYKMSGIPEIPDDPAGVTYLQDAWADVDGWAASGGTGAISVSGGIATITNPTKDTYISRVLTASNNSIRIKIRQTEGTLGLVRVDLIGATTISPPSDRTLSRDWKIFDYSFTGSINSINILYVEYYLSTGTLEIDWIYIGTGAYLPNSLLDNSGNGNHGTIYGATPVEGISGKALEFDGVNDYVELSTPINRVTGEELSVSVWIKQNTKTGYQDIFAAYDGAAINWLLRTEATGALDFRNGSTAGVFSYIPAIGVQMHVVVVVNASGDRLLYINGALWQVLPGFTFGSASSRFFMGAEFSNSNFWDGTIDEPRIYNRALSAEEVYSLYLNPSQGNDNLTKSVRGVANSLVVRNASGQLQDMADYGVGTTSALCGDNFNTINKTGFYSGYNATGAPSAGYWQVEHIQYIDTQYAAQIAHNVTAASPITKERRKDNGTWGAWYEVWNAFNDGNGGQPPAPKPRVATDSDIGNFRTITFGDNVDAVLPSGGVCLYQIQRYNTNYASVASPVWYSLNGIAAGGTTILGGESGRVTTGSIWRIS